MLVRVALFLIACVAGPALAEPLTFGAINGVEDASRNPALARCEPGSQSCALTRTSFGGLPVVSSVMTLNPSGRIRSVEIVLNGKDHGLARELLAGRYGPPTHSDRWTNFDDGAVIGFRRAGARAIVSLDFPANATAARSGGGEVAWPVLIFAGLGLAAGLGAYGIHKRLRPAPADTMGTVSMRETLERRLRQGDEVTF